MTPAIPVFLHVLDNWSIKCNIQTRKFRWTIKFQSKNYWWTIGMLSSDSFWSLSTSRLHPYFTSDSIVLYLHIRLQPLGINNVPPLQIRELRTPLLTVRVGWTGHRSVKQSHRHSYWRCYLLIKKWRIKLNDFKSVIINVNIDKIRDHVPMTMIWNTDS